MTTKRQKPTLLGRLGMAVLPLLSRHRRAAPLRAMAALCSLYLTNYKSPGCTIDTNGERRVLDLLGSAEPRCVLDVGANLGDWALTARRAFPSAAIHCFEVVPATAALLASRLSGQPDFIVNPFGLGDTTSDVDVLFYPDEATLSAVGTYGAFPWTSYAKRCESVVGQIRRGDEYITEQSIDRIDFLKIDTEGAELRVLTGFRETLAAGRVDVIQFEYGTAAIYSRGLLRDLYELLEPLGYSVGKIFPTYVDFRPYTVLDEDFLGPNYLAVRTARRELLALLS